MRGTRGWLHTYSFNKRSLTPTMCCSAGCWDPRGGKNGMGLISQSIQCNGERDKSADK